MVDLFHEFISNIMFKQMSMFFMKLADLIQSISSKFFRFPYFFHKKKIKIVFIFFSVLSATYGLIVTVITLFFMKDILKTMIYSVFKFILNPTSWSNFATAVQNGQNEVPQRSSVSQIASGDDIKDVNMGKALDLANSKIQLILTENAISAAIKAHLSPPSVQRTSSIEGTVTVERQSNHLEASEAKLSSNPSNSHWGPSGIQQLADKDESTSSDSSAGRPSDSESYEEITYDELVLATHVDVLAMVEIEPLSAEGQTSLSDELAILGDGESSKSSSCSTLPSDIELLNGDLDGFSDKNNLIT